MIPYLLYLDDKCLSYRNPITYCPYGNFLPINLGNPILSTGDISILSLIEKNLGMSLAIVLASNLNEFSKALDLYGLPRAVSFDHDLGSPDDHQTGANAARELCFYCAENNFDMPACFVHTDNYPGRKNIESIIKSYIKINGM
jgi:hypothetical protein